MGLLSAALRRRPKAAVADPVSAPGIGGWGKMSAAQRHFYASDTSMSLRERAYREEQLKRRFKNEYPDLAAVPVEQQFPGWRVQIGEFVVVDKQTNEVVAGDYKGRSFNLDELEAWLDHPITDVDAAAAAARESDGDVDSGRDDVVEAIAKDLRIDVDRQGSPHEQGAR